MSNQDSKSVYYLDGQFFTAGSFIPVFTPLNNTQASVFLAKVRAVEAKVQRKLTVGELTRLGGMVNVSK